MKLVFAGTPEFAVPSLLALHAAGHELLAVFTQPDRPAGRGRKLQPSAVAQVTQRLGLRLLKPERLDEACRDLLRQISPDVIIVVAYGLLLPPEILDIPPFGCLNVHASLLPRWRGAAPIARAIEAGDVRTGVCIMRMDSGLDTGPVLARAAWSIPDGASAADATSVLSALGARLLVDVLPVYAAGALRPQPQVTSGITYARKLTKEEARLDWTRPASELARCVHAFNPAPVAWTLLAAPTTNGGSERIRIWDARAEAKWANAPPGTIVATDSEGIHVAAGVGTLCLLTLQRAGGRIRTSPELLLGWDLAGRYFI